MQVAGDFDAVASCAEAQRPQAQRSAAPRAIAAPGAGCHRVSRNLQRGAVGDVAAVPRQVGFEHVGSMLARDGNLMKFGACCR